MNRRPTLILGGGISGLAAAFALQKQKRPFHLIEKKNRVGGWIDTIEEKGFLFETGPRSCRSTGEGIATLQLIESLGLQDAICTSDPKAAKRFLYKNKKLQEIPTSFASCFTSPLTWTLLKGLLREPWIQKGASQNETIHSFFSRRFGKAFADTFAPPMAQGIFGGDSRALSMQACFPDLVSLEQEFRSLLWGAWKKRGVKDPHLSPFVQKMQQFPLFSLKGGLKTLIQTLYTHLKPSIHLNSAAKSLAFSQDTVTITLETGETIEGAALISTLPAPALATLIYPYDGRTAHLLEKIPYVSLASVHLGYRHPVLQGKKGFGYLIHPSENEHALGIVWDSCIFPMQNTHPEETRLTIMLKAHKSQTDETLLHIARDTLKRHLGIVAEPDALRISKAPHALPQYLPGHTERVQEIEHALQKLYPRFYLGGCASRSVSVNGCIAQGKSLIAALDCK